MAGKLFTACVAWRRSVMRQLGKQAPAGEHPLSGRNLDAHIDWHLDLGKASEPQVGTTLPLPDPFAIAQKGEWRQAQAMSVKLQYHVIALIGLHP